MASSDILTKTLHAVTGIKLAQLEKQRHGYENAKRKLLTHADDERDSRKRTRLLVDGAEKLPSMTPLAESPLVSLSNIRRFVEQADCDPSISEGFLAGYEKTVREQLDAQSNKYDFATLYGKLVTDWTSASREAAAVGLDTESDIVAVASGREEMHKQRATWEEYVFHAKDIDPAAINTYLNDLFAHNPSKDVISAFTTLKTGFKTFQKNWDKETKHFTKDTVTGCIKGILRGDVISDYKRSVLNDFLGNDIVIKEIADVLNMRMATREDFAWEGVTTVQQRRQLNGRYRFYPDEDLLQTIFLQYIGLKWATELRRLLRDFALADDVMKSPTSALTREEARRRRYFLGVTNPHVPQSVESNTAQHWENEIFLDQLPEEMFETRGAYGDDKSEGEDGDSRSSPLAVVQELLHRVQANVMIQRRMGKDTTVIRSDFKWFGPSLPHQSIFTVLEYFGIQDDWLEFFKTTLEAPMTFEDEGAEPQIRKRGTPIGTPLGTFFGEALLFCADFSVNQKTEGSRLYRLHDDLWLWGDVDTCAQGWNALTEFAGLMGLEFNEEKTGCCTILKDGSAANTADIPSSLPHGDVVWGFLKLDAESGRFVINQAKVDAHAEELSLQLKACKSVFDFVQAWNLYGARFFRTNCGKVAQCFGRKHVDSMLETFKRIQSLVFATSNGSVTQYLKKMIAERVGVTDVPDGFLYFPTSMGGLGLQNPFVDLYLIRDRVTEDPLRLMNRFFEHEESVYREKKRRFEEKEGVNRTALPTRDVDEMSLSSEQLLDMPNDEEEEISWGQPPDGWASQPINTWETTAISFTGPEYHDLRNSPFMDYAEYTQHREITSATLGSLYTRLLRTPTPLGINLQGEAAILAQHIEARDEEGGSGWSSYDKWVLQLYAKETIAQFGSLDIVEEGLLPMGLMKMLRQSRFKWQN